MKTDETREMAGRRLTWVLLTAVFALTLVVGLSLCLSHVQVRAEPAAETTAADFDVTKEGSQGTVAPGDAVVYTITVRNSGDASATAWLTDRLPGELSYVSETLSAPFGTWGVQEDTITWTGDLAGFDQAVVLTFGAEISSELIYAEIVNTAQVTGAGELVEDSALLTAVGEVGNLDTDDTTKSVSSAEGEPGDILTYTIRIANTDSSDQHSVPNARLTDTLPTGLSYVPGSLTNIDSSASLGVDDGVITWHNTLDYPSYDEIQFSAQITAGVARDSWLTNHVQIEAPFQAFTRSVGTYIRPDIYATYMPLMFKGWPPLPYAVSLADVSNEDLDGDYTVNWSYDDAYPDVTEPVSYTLQQATTAELNDWTTLYEGTGTSHPFVDQAPGTYYYRVRGHNEYGAGPWSAVKSAEVGGEPYAPTLNEIPNDDEDQSYRVSWTYDESYSEVTRPDSYLLQEACDEDFTDDVVNIDPADEGDCVVDGSGGYCDMDNDSGTYYYRVRGENEDGTGPWSNVEEVYVWEYEDDFSDYESGWPRVWEDTRGALYQVRPYEHPDCGPGKDCKYDDGDGYIVARRQGEAKPLAQFTPKVEVPSTNYQLEVDARWFEGSVNATYVVYFSSEDDFDTYYALKVRIDDPKQNPPECDFKVYKHTEDEELIFADWTRSDSIHCGLVRCREDDNDDRCGSTSWNEWKIERDGENGKKISVEVNGDFLGRWSDHDPLGSDRVFGFGATNYEGFTPSKPVFDKLEVELQD